MNSIRRALDCCNNQSINQSINLSIKKTNPALVEQDELKVHAIFLIVFFLLLPCVLLVDGRRTATPNCDAVVVVVALVLVLVVFL